MRSVWLTLAVITILFLPINSVFADEEIIDEKEVVEEESNNDNIINKDNNEDNAITDNKDIITNDDEIIVKEKELDEESYKLIVHYLNEDGIKIYDDLVLEKSNNDSYTIDIPDIDDYIYKNSSLPLEGIIKADTEITINYIKDETIDLDDEEKPPIKDESEQITTDGTFLSLVATNDDIANSESFTNPDTADNIDLYFGLLFITMNLIISLIITKRYCLE